MVNSFECSRKVQEYEYEYEAASRSLVSFSRSSFSGMLWVEARLQGIEKVVISEVGAHTVMKKAGQTGAGRWVLSYLNRWGPVRVFKAWG